MTTSPMPPSAVRVSGLLDLEGDVPLGIHDLLVQAPDLCCTLPDELPPNRVAAAQECQRGTPDHCWFCLWEGNGSFWSPSHETGLPPDATREETDRYWAAARVRGAEKMITRLTCGDRLESGIGSAESGKARSYSVRFFTSSFGSFS